MRVFEKPIAHRGLHNEEIPENSMAAFKKAVEAGYNIEIDVRLLKDGNVVIFHDKSLKRVVGVDGDVEKLTLADIKGDKYLLKDGQRLPLFEELIAEVDGKVDILCELKSRGVRKFTLEENVYKLIKDKPWIKVQSFNPFSLIWFRNNAPEVIRGQLATDTTNRVLRAAFRLSSRYLMLNRTRPHFLAYDIRYLPSTLVENAVKAYNMRLITWTVRTEEEKARAAESGAENIIFESVNPEGFQKKI